MSWLGQSNVYDVWVPFPDSKGSAMGLIIFDMWHKCTFAINLGSHAIHINVKYDYMRERSQVPELV